MMDTVYHLGHEAARIGSPAGGFSTVSGTFDALFSRCSVRTKYDQHHFFLTQPCADSTEYWAHTTLYIATSAYGTQADILFGLDTSGGYKSIQLISANERLIKPRLFNYEASTYVDGPAITLAYSTRYAVDLHVHSVDDATVCDLYVDSVLVSSATRAGAAFNGFSRVELGGLGMASTYYSYAYFSELALANFDTRGHRVTTRPPTGAGAHTESTGGYQNIDEVTPDGAYALFTAPGQRLTTTHASLPSALYVVKAVAVSGLSASDGSNTLNSLLRVDGTDHLGPVIAADPAMAPRMVVYAENPITGEPWSGDLSNVEFGFQCVGS